MRKLIGLSVLIFTVFSCSQFSQTAYYPRSHFIPLFEGTDGAKTLANLSWGDKLIYQETKAITNISKDGSKTNANTFIKVKFEMINSTGYVNAKDVIKDPIARAIILNPKTMVYQTPTTSKGYTSVEPPILLYIIETKDNEWAKIEPYNAWSAFSLTNMTPIDSTHRWILLKDLSTNQQNVDLIISLQYAIQKYNSALKAGKNTPNFEKEVKDLAANMQNNLSKYSQADASAISYVQSFLDLINPGVNENNGESPQGEESSAASTSEGDDNL